VEAKARLDRNKGGRVIAAKADQATDLLLLLRATLLRKLQIVVKRPRKSPNFFSQRIREETNRAAASSLRTNTALLSIRYWRANCATKK